MTCCDYVHLELFQQCVFTREFLNIANPSKDLEFQVRPIKISREVEDMDLDFGRVFTEGGIGANVHCRREPRRHGSAGASPDNTACVDTMSRNEDRYIHEVGRRESQRAAASCPMSDVAHDSIR